MRQLILGTNAEWLAFILRIIAGLTMLPHGLQKMFGWFNGYGFRNTMQFLTTSVKLPRSVALLVIFIEVVGAAGLLFGAGTRIWSLLLIILMTGAIITTNWRNGFFMNWTGNQAGEGCEYHLLYIGICIALLSTGGGRFSADYWLQ